MIIEKKVLHIESMDIAISVVDDLQSQIKERLKNIFPDSSELPIKEFTGSYEDFLTNWVPAPASKNQFLAIAIKNIGIDKEELVSFVEALNQNGIVVKNETDFIDNYVFSWADENIPFILSQIIEGDCKQYIYLSGEFMFNKIKKYLQ